MRKRVTRWALLVMGAALLAGCGQVATGPEGPNEASATGAAPVTDSGKLHQRRLAAMSPGKPGLAVTARIILEAPLQAGIPAAATLVLRAATPADALVLTLEGGSGVELIAPRGPLVLGPVAAGEDLEVPLQLQLAGMAEARLAANLVLEAGGQRRARALSLNLPATDRPAAIDGSAGARLPKSKASPVRDATGELIRPMRVDTIVRE